MKFLNARRAAYHTDPRRIDEVIYSPYLYQPNSTPQSNEGRSPVANVQNQTGDLLGIPELHNQEEERPPKKRSKFHATPAEAEIFLFEYGTVVLWGMTEAQEKRFLSSMFVSRAVSFFPTFFSVESDLRSRNSVGIIHLLIIAHPRSNQLQTLWRWRT